MRRMLAGAVLCASLLLLTPVTVAEASVAGPGHGTVSRIEVPYEMFRLPNGLTVILHEDHTIPVVSVNVWYHVGSGREHPGRTGFAHLFEHLMFEGSEHVPEGAFDHWMESVGGYNNGSTTEDRTNYWSNLPSNALELGLFLESDRMGFLLQSMSRDVVDHQRDVVKNEMRQSYQNRPYGRADLALPALLFPAGHPYSWPVIGSMDDLSAASYEDVTSFFRRYYGPANATLVVAGDLEPARARSLVEKWFSEVPASTPVPPPTVPPVLLSGETRRVLEDRVDLPKLAVAWPTVRRFDPSEAALDVLADVLGRGKNSRLHRKLVYEMQIAQRVDVYHDTGKYGGRLVVEVLARPGHDLNEILDVVDGELKRLRREGVSERETLRAVHQKETAFLDRMERVGGFYGKADLLNLYWFYAGDPDWFAEDLARYRSLAPDDVAAAATRWIGPGRVILSVVPEGHAELGVAPPAGKEVRP